MKRVTVRALSVGIIAGALLVAASAGRPAFWRAYLAPERAPTGRSVVLAGGDGGSLPRATAAEQGLDPEALRVASGTADALGAKALLIARRGHLVHEQMVDGAQARLRSSLLARLVLGAGVAVAATQGSEPDTAVLRESLEWSRRVQGVGSAHNPWSTRSQARFGAASAPPLRGDLTPAGLVAAIDAKLWRPLGAASASYDADGAGNPRLHCCLWLRPRDGLALAVALFAGGRVGAELLLPAAAAGEIVTALDDGVAPRGAEPFGARAARLLRDDEGTRLYFFPAQELVILLMAADEARLGDETELAHQVLRGIVDRTGPTTQDPTRALVPQH